MCDRLKFYKGSLGVEMRKAPQQVLKPRPRKAMYSFHMHYFVVL